MSMIAGNGAKGINNESEDTSNSDAIDSSADSLYVNPGRNEIGRADNFGNGVYNPGNGNTHSHEPVFGHVGGQTNFSGGYGASPLHSYNSGPSFNHSPGYGYGNQNGYGDVPNAESAVSSIDVYGALLRRKSVLILLALIGCGVAYLLYRQAVPVFASTLRLMISNQAPPSIVNGEFIQPTVSIPKQMNLISSELVLSTAIRKGNLDRLPSFVDEPSVLGRMRLMIKVQPADKEQGSDTIVISCQSPHETDCPVILEQVFAAYTSILEEDNAAAGKESVMLLEKVQEQLKNDQDISNQRYLELVKKLNLSAENDRGMWVNPYAEDIHRTKEEREKIVNELRDVMVLVDHVREAMDKETTKPELVRLAVLDARKYFQMNQQASNELDLNFSDVETKASAARLNQRLENIEADLYSAQANRARLLKSFGPKHNSVVASDSEVESLEGLRERIKSQLKDLYATVESTIESPRASDISSEEARAKDYDSQLTRLYATNLVRLRDKHKAHRDELTTKLVELEQQASTIAGDMAELNVLKERIEDRRAAITQLLEKLSAINVVSNNFNSTKVRAIDSASRAEQVAPMLVKYLVLGTLAGLLLGGGLAVLIDQSDLSYRTPIDIHHNLKSPVICKIPNIKRAKADPTFAGSPMLVASSRPNSPASETFRAARTALLFAAQKMNGKVFLFTSPSPGDGKSTTTSNLAVSLAQTGKRVLLIDADFRRPRVQQYFGLQFEPGVMDILDGRSNLNEAARTSEFQPNLYLLTTGGRPKNPGEIVTGQGFKDIVQQAREIFDFILIDSPPVLPVADATAMASQVDGVFLILRIRRGVMLASRKAKEMLDMVNARVLGVIVNGMDENVYYNEYGYYYRGAYYSGSTRYYDTVNSTYSEKVAANL